MTDAGAATDGAFRDVMGRFATGVAIVTVAVDGEVHGMTANALASVSLEPLLVLVCIERGTVTAELLERCGSFAVSILASDQAELSVRFADRQRPRGRVQFEGTPWEAGVTGAPIITGSIAHVECRVWRSYPGGDHDIVVGQVVGVGRGDDREPLIYYRGGYRELC